MQARFSFHTVRRADIFISIGLSRDKRELSANLLLMYTPLIVLCPKVSVHKGNETFCFKIYITLYTRHPVDDLHFFVNTHRVVSPTRDELGLTHLALCIRVNLIAF